MDSVDFKSFAKNNLVKTLHDFLNELSLSFEETVPNLPSIKKHFKQICKESQSAVFEAFVQNVCETLRPFEENIKGIVLAKRKIKTHQYEFLNSIDLAFNNDLSINFKVFNTESKSTKKTLLQHLYTILMMCNIYTSSDFNLTAEQLSVIGDMFNPAPNSSNDVTPKKQSPNKSSPSANSISTLMDSVMANPDIVNIAKEISVDIQSQNIDPMSMINGLMSGKPSAQLEGLISKIGSKIDQKISSGEIDGNVLEQQAVNILNNVNLSETLKHLGSSSRKVPKK